MQHTPMLQPADVVWLPMLDAGAPEPAPEGAEGVRSVSLGRHACAGEIRRTVVVETEAGFAPLARRVHVHGDVDEGWDWGWRGSAPLDTSLNLLLHFVHPRAAWRLQWAFCEAFLHPLPASGAILKADEIRAWLRRNAWIGRQRTWTTAGEAARDALVAAERERSRDLAPASRASHVADLVSRGTGIHPHRTRGRLPGRPMADGRELERAAALLEGAPPEQRWATLALLAGHLPPAGSAAREAWRTAAAPITPGLPDPDSITAVAAVWSRLVGRAAAERAGILAEAIRSGAPSSREWRTVPLLAYPLGGGIPSIHRSEICIAGDPLQAAATLHALSAAIDVDPGLRTDAESIGLSTATIAECTRAAHALHVGHLRTARREAESQAAANMQRVQAAEAARLPRGRSQPPPPASDALRRWALEAPLPLLMELARTGRGPDGPLALRGALHACGIVFPDPAGTVAATLTWYTEERNPAVLDAPTFLIRADGLPHTPGSAEVFPARGGQGAPPRAA